MKVDRAKAIRMDFGEETFYFCSEHCLHAFEVDPHVHRGESSEANETKVADAHAY
jgi:YHS domain-containing protein